VNIHTGLIREFRTNANFVMAGGVLLFMHGEIRQEFYETSWLSIRLPSLNMKKAPTEKQRTGTERTLRMVADAMQNRFGENCHDALAFLPLVKVVRAGKENKLAAIPNSINDFLEQQELYFEEAQNG